MKKPVLVIDGVVGCGKTTLAKILEKELGMPLYEEIGSQDTINLLDRFYAKRTRWGFTLQIHFLNTRFRQIKDIHANGGGMLDRSIFGDRLFAEMMAEDLEDGGEGMTWEEFRTYSTLLDSMLEHAQAPTLLVYLECDVDTAIERINKRDRGLESQVERGYWERLNDKYATWYEKYDASPKVKINVANLDYDSCEEDRKKVVEIVKAELAKVEGR
ncbi:deoxynucleoside kinase [Bacillus thuringiensis]|uniref:deoxynucleoside kinase n=1 Tax=Bacillus thuringiensis TaxID=1428 RepID=UPI0011122A5C|nr:deoxynucleoside kinase [Bacillus thuringiensis]QCY65024.1 deoxyguanosine kinase [Bacillus thuringiensis]